MWAHGVTIYLDESGCLGWKLTEPYLRGGSSQYFTLAAVVIPDGRESVLNRVVRGLYKKRGRAAKNELKSVVLSRGEHERFALALPEIHEKHPDIRFMAITVRKENVNGAFRRNPNGLYNFMVKCLLLDLMREHESVCFIPDKRSMKVEYKHGLHEYLSTELASICDTALQTTPWKSKDCLPLQFVDILAGVVWAHHEYGNASAYWLAEPYLTEKHLFIGNPVRHEQLIELY
ncbi:DUF3800 domain-containing protein [Paraburkholderia humisilvae]|uniref:DUF3800 domain-containing protein n=1 Tax=Paraburkholderia humisilvae TaxID=627669 RepID=A0A6J5E7C7_9BURK|nr:DUF3800 domain-containing protein [Paraburkholderia humisilvae]CAB3762418.1 hypothetical protein LMG29542_04352 [Paraburkholderia humisilvae]